MFWTKASNSTRPALVLRSVTKGSPVVERKEGCGETGLWTPSTVLLASVSSHALHLANDTQVSLKHLRSCIGCIQTTHRYP